MKYKDNISSEGQKDWNIVKEWWIGKKVNSNDVDDHGDVYNYNCQKKKDKMMMETKMVPGKKKTNNFGVLVFLLQNYD